jgi:aspartyl-tRNA(Asn)/glutamyl-tRNA(Gln) amidotransferase subunit A
MTNEKLDSKKPNELTIAEAAKALRAGEITVRELFDACITAANERNKELNAYLELFTDAQTDAAIEAAQKRIDAEVSAATKGEANKDAHAPLLCGIPLAIKDNILIHGRIDIYWSHKYGRVCTRKFHRALGVWSDKKPA